MRKRRERKEVEETCNQHSMNYYCNLKCFLKPIIRTFEDKVPLELSNQTISDDLRSNRPILLAEELLEIILKDIFLFGENQPQ